MQIQKKSLYKPKHLENLSKDIKEKIEKKKLKKKKKIIRFLLKK